MHLAVQPGEVNLSLPAPCLPSVLLPAGMPTAVSLTLTDRIVEGMVVSPRCDYKGGQEGRSQWEWFCLPKSHLDGRAADVASLKCLGRDR